MLNLLHPVAMNLIQSQTTTEIDNVISSISSNDSDPTTQTISPFLSTRITSEPFVSSDDSSVLNVSLPKDSSTPSQNDQEERNDKKRYPCPHCGLRLSTSSNRSRHISRIHSHLRPRFPCLLCGTVFYNALPLQQHVKQCKGPNSEQTVQTKSSYSISLKTLASPSMDANCWTDSCSQQPFVSLSQPTTTENQGEFVANKATENNSIDTSANLEIDTLNLTQLDDPILMMNSQSKSIINSNSSNSLTIKKDLQQVSGPDEFQCLSPGIVNSICQLFFNWLSSTPESWLEHGTKRKRIHSPKQLIPIRTNLKHLFTILMQNGVACRDLNLNLFTRVECIRWIHTDLMQRQVKAERMYSLYLLIKKVLLFLVSTQSKMAHTIVHPQSLESYILVENRCFEYSMLKKRESYNRSMGSLQLSTQSALQTSKTSIIAPTHIIEQSLSKNELQQLCQSALKKIKTLQELLMKPVIETSENICSLNDSKNANEYVRLLFVLTLSLCCTPRKQVFAALRLHQTLIKKADGSYWIYIPADQSKDGKTVITAISRELTQFYDFYFIHVRPLLVKEPDAGFVFPSD